MFKETRLLMDTFAEVSCFSREKEIALNAINGAFKEMERIERLFNKFEQESEVSKINALAGVEKIEISSELFEIIERSIYYSGLSGGSFDITVEPMKKGRYKEIMLDKEKSSIRFSSEDIKIDLGGIAKGYAVDRAKDILLSHGIEDALINIGGNIFALGNPPGKKGWRIGIRDPRDKSKVIYRLTLKDKGVSTSAGYERPSHIIDPGTGRSIEGIRSVTIVARSAEKADALSTAVFVMGIEDGIDLVQSLEGVEGYIFDKELNLTSIQ